MVQCDKCHVEFKTDSENCSICGGPTTAVLVAATVGGGDAFLSTSNQASNSDSSSGLLGFSGILMGLVGLIAAFFLFSNAKSGWGGLDNKMGSSPCR